MSIPYPDLLKLFYHEWTAKEAISRVPEPSSDMSEAANVEAFHSAGEPGGLLEPIYFFNAKKMSELLKFGANVLDLGCGSGQAIRYLAQIRPDIKITGIDLSEPMILRGRKMLESYGLSRQVNLIKGDMTELESLKLGPIDLISSVFSFHHLPNLELARKCADQIKKMIDSTQCNFWCFDHVRPRSKKTAELFPKIFSKDYPIDLQIDSTNSLMAAFSMNELREIFGELQSHGIKSQRARILPFYQVHWIQRDLSHPKVPTSNLSLHMDSRLKQKEFAWLMNIKLPKCS